MSHRSDAHSVALVTGASSGIGATYAERLASSGRDSRPDGPMRLRKASAEVAHRGVALHSFTEKLDLSSATGRMFYNILGAFARFYREQLAENVRLGMHQAARQGKWTNRPKFGYDLVGGELVPNADAPTVRRIFELRAQGLSYPRIEELTGVKYSTARTVACSRIYLGEVLLNGRWYPGNHEPLVTAKEFSAAHRGEVPWQRRSRHVLAGRVRCGLCGRVATIRYGREGRPLYRCRHRGDGCSQPSRSAVGLVAPFCSGCVLSPTTSTCKRLSVAS